MVAKINADSCAGCGSCIGECPAGAISINDSDVSFVIEDECTNCGLCLDICAHGAISIG
ncbi:Electron transport complex subunit RsxB [bioreactor metagenome]|uniref:Electron transport complex subunit RsxB n=1 Tax=bioreactor metagenome TaxID=1076179 RepID=A0A645DX72_9ZZZZ